MTLPEIEIYREQIEKSLDKLLPPEEISPRSIHRSIRYSACRGGKRLRGILCLLACDTVGGEVEKALPASCALEMVHAYSLVHDDLPCMDDDDLRRGKPTNHLVFGEAIALLAGDALLTEAVKVLATKAPTGMEELYRQALGEMITAVNTGGMIGGQVLDLEAEGKDVDLKDLMEIHQRKTGALITAALRMGGIIGKGDRKQLAALSQYGRSFGLAFQIGDDLLDCVGDSKKLGKKIGSDVKNNKATYPALLGLDESRRLLRLEVDKAQKALGPFGERAGLLHSLVDYLVRREY